MGAGGLLHFQFQPADVHLASLLLFLLSSTIPFPSARTQHTHTHAQPFLSPLHLFFPPLFISLPLFFSLIIVEDVKQAIALSHHGPP